MGLIRMAIDALRFKDTIFYKENSDLQLKFDALSNLKNEYPDNEEIINELNMVKKGLDGENEIEYQLKKANIGMYVLRDIKLEYKDLTAQIDYVIITPVFIYYVECKNLIGNIIVNEKGDFIREFYDNGEKIKKGIYSPLRQVEAQREVVRKIWQKNISTLDKILASQNFDYYRRVLVVAANPDTIIDTSNAPKDIKYKILRADSLVRQIEYDLNHRKKDDYVETQKNMEKIAENYCKLSSQENINYYDFYKAKYCSISNENNNLKDKLIEFRKERAKEMNIPLYYVFSNEELEKIVELKPKNLNELKDSNILPLIKTKTHGEKIINIINNKKN